MPSFAAKVTAVLDYLVEKGHTDPTKVGVCGISRGSLAALHWAAVDPRVQAIAAIAPVTDLLTLREFEGMEEHSNTNTLAAVTLAGKLAGRYVWVSIGHHDVRVGTDHAIAFTRRLVEASIAEGKPARVELHVIPTEDHRAPANAHQEAAAWFLSKLGEGPTK